MTKRELIETASAKIERIFDESGKVLAMWHIVTPEGEKVLPPPPSTNKDHAIAIVRASFMAWGVTAYVFIDEAWMRIVNLPPNSPEGEAEIAYSREHGVRDHPDRVEVVIFSAEDETGALTAWRKIIRKVNARPRLGPLEIKDNFTSQEGRFVGLLPQRGTRH
jgi:hypothetical protein